MRLTQRKQTPFDVGGDDNGIELSESGNAFGIAPRKKLAEPLRVCGPGGLVADGSGEELNEAP